ncbi:MAG: DUF3667 domain-containing protein [Sediminibacterium sp.]|nr:DUF3667 domain-containing protein [Sediminibacterium sp.]
MRHVKETIVCKNCGFPAGGNYCGNCGQSRSVHKINFKSILHEIQHGLFHVDKGILFTINELFFRPGNAIRDYLEGKRIAYFKPFAFAFIIATVYALLNGFWGNNSPVSVKISYESESLLWIVSLLHWMEKYYAYGNILMLPLVSFGSYWAFAITKRNFAEHLVLNAYVSGQVTFVYLLIVILCFMFGFERDPVLLSLVNISIDFVLRGWMYFSFLNNLKYYLRVLLVSYAYILMGGVLVIGVSIIFFLESWV